MHKTIRQKAGTLIGGIGLLLLILAGLSSVLAVPGDLDPGFDNDGKLTLDLAGDDFANAMIAYPGDRLVIGGVGGTQFGLARLNTDGSLDTTFSGDGKQLTSIDGPTGVNDTIYALAKDHTDRILAAGDNGADFAVVRYRGDNGNPDTDFSTDGRQTTSLSGGLDTAYAVLEADNFRVIVAGAAGSDFGLVRYGENGTPDTTFDGDGIVTTSISAGNDVIYDIMLWDIGYLVVGTNGSDIVLARYNANGTLDTTFDTDGILTTDLGTSSDIAYAVALDSLGRIVVGGQTGSDSVVLRYLADGTLDSTFDGDGIKVAAVSAVQIDRINAIAIQQPNDRIVTGGVVYTDSTHSQFNVMRFLNTGALDTVFSGDGMVTTSFVSGLNEATGIVVNSSNRIIAGGSSNFADFLKDFALARFDGSDGSEATWTATVPTDVPTDTPTETATATDTAIKTPTDPPTLTFTPTPSSTQTTAPTDTPSVTPSPTRTLPPSATSTGTITDAPTFTPTLTASVTETPTITETVTNTATATLDPSSTELLVNGGFEDQDAENKPVLSPWTLKKGIGDKIKCDQPDKPVAHTGVCAFLFKGGVGERASLIQIIDLTGVSFATNDSLNLSVFANAKNATASLKLKLIVTYTDLADQGKQTLLIGSTSGYVEQTTAYTLASGSVSKIKLLAKHTSLKGKIFLDDFSLRLVPGATVLVPLP